jgi:hypothetical protein
MIFMDDDDDQKNVCRLCVNENYLSNLICNQVTVRVCSYCNSVESVMRIEELANHVEGAFKRHFIRTSNKVDGAEYYLLADQESSYEWRRPGEPVLDVIMGAAQIGEAVAQDILAILNCRHADFNASAMQEETEFDSESYYESAGLHNNELQAEWDTVESGVKTRSRYFNRTAEDFFTRIFGRLDSLKNHCGTPIVVTAGPDCETKAYFRARVFDGTANFEQALARPDLELGPPPPKVARAGRMNAQGISVFYGASDAQTAIAEVRPPVGSRVIVGQFCLLKQVRLLDLQALSAPVVEGSCFDPEYLEQLKLVKFLSSLTEKMTMPVMPSDEPSEYLITQMVAEYLSCMPDPVFDGMMYPSVQNNGAGDNVVLFNHASRVKQSEFKKGTTIAVRTYERDEHGGEFNYSVSEEVPLVNEEAQKIRLSSEDTLLVDAKSLQVHHIDSVSYRTTDFKVARTRNQRGN